MPLTYSSIEEVRRDCEFYQKVLRLQDWIVRCRFGTEGNGIKQGCKATVHTVIHNKTAEIVLLRSDDYPQSIWPQDMEVSLVHELLHLHFMPLDWIAFGDQPSSEVYKVAEEQAIECIAWGIVHARRSGGNG